MTVPEGTPLSAAPIRRFETEAELLAWTPIREAQRAQVLGGPYFIWTASDGWIEETSAPEVAAEVATVAGTLPAPDQLVPLDGTPGQILIAGPTSVREFATRDSASGFTPVTFTDGLAHEFLNRTIPGGALGPNGYVRFGASGLLRANAGTFTRVLTLVCSTGLTLVTPAVTLETSVRHFAFEGILRNVGSETTGQIREAALVAGRSTVVPELAYDGNASGAVDTSVDWLLTLSIQAATSFANGGDVQAGWVEIVYAP